MGLDLEQAQRLRELQELADGERLRRLERRDLLREDLVESMNTVMARAEKVLWIGVGGIGVRIIQEGGAELVKSLVSLVIGG